MKGFYLPFVEGSLAFSCSNIGERYPVIHTRRIGGFVDYKLELCSKIISYHPNHIVLKCLQL